ncbi:TPA: antiviral reverse transcriptase Drt3a [Providencia alcalifaciens]
MLQQDFSENSLRGYLYPSDFIKNRELLSPHDLKAFFDILKDYLKFIDQDKIALRILDISNKAIFNTECFHHKIILRRCDYILKKLFDINVKNRHLIIDELVVFIKENPSYTIVRTDIKSFFESIEHSFLINELDNKKELSYITYNIIFQLIQSYKLTAGTNKGVPRGLEISSSLAEIALIKFDREINKNNDVLYYGRFVDDIILVMKNNADHISFLKKILPGGLALNKLKSKSILLKSFPEYKGDFYFNYLGYKFSFPNIDLSGKKRKGVFRTVVISISESKIKKIKSNISKAFYAFYRDNNFELLMDRLFFLSTNRTILCEKTKRKIPTGIYFNYSKITDKADLNNIDLFLKKMIFDKSIRINKVRRNSFNKHQINRLLKINFESSFCNIVYKKFNINRLKEITRIWQ